MVLVEIRNCFKGQTFTTQCSTLTQDSREIGSRSPRCPMSCPTSTCKVAQFTTEGLPDFATSCVMRDKIRHDDTDGYSPRGLNDQCVHFRPAEQL